MVLKCVPFLSVRHHMNIYRQGCLAVTSFIFLLNTVKGRGVGDTPSEKKQTIFNVWETKSTGYKRTLCNPLYLYLLASVEIKTDLPISQKTTRLNVFEIVEIHTECDTMDFLIECRQLDGRDRALKTLACLLNQAATVGRPTLGPRHFWRVDDVGSVLKWVFLKSPTICCCLLKWT